jgi:hypothetical protein
LSAEPLQQPSQMSSAHPTQPSPTAEVPANNTKRYSHDLFECSLQNCCFSGCCLSCNLGLAYGKLSDQGCCIGTILVCCTMSITGILLKTAFPLAFVVGNTCSDFGLSMWCTQQDIFFAQMTQTLPLQCVLGNCSHVPISVCVHICLFVNSIQPCSL